MKQKLIDLVNHVASIQNDAWNPKTYFDNRNSCKNGMLHSKYILGNLYAKGYDTNICVNFEIFKDHSGYQIWIWNFNSDKNPDRNDFNCPYYATDKLIAWIEKTF